MWRHLVFYKLSRLHGCYCARLRGFACSWLNPSMFDFGLKLFLFHSTKNDRLSKKKNLQKFELNKLWSCSEIFCGRLFSGVFLAFGFSALIILSIEKQYSFYQISFGFLVYIIPAMFISSFKSRGLAFIITVVSILFA